MLRGNKLLIFAVKLIFSLILVTILFAFLVPKYNWLVVQASNGLISLIERPFQKTILRAEGGDIRVLLHSSAQGEEFIPIVSYNYELYYGLVLLVALLLATPSIKLLKRLEFTLIACGALFAFHATAVAIIARSDGAFQPLPVVIFEFFSPAIPVVLWGILTFRYWLPLPRAAANPKFASKSAKVGRNAPCPCGSGKKYKNCCGKRG